MKIKIFLEPPYLISWRMAKNKDESLHYFAQFMQNILHQKHFSQSSDIQFWPVCHFLSLTTIISENFSPAFDQAKWHD